MKPAILLILAGVLTLSPPGSATAATNENSTDDKIDFTSFGMGISSCATWLATPTQERDGGNWILGFFSAANLASADHHDVGGSVGPAAIVTEVRTLCADEPRMRMGEAAARVYKAFEHDRK